MMDDILRNYYELDYHHLEMLSALTLQHNIFISLNTLINKLKSLNLIKYKIHSDLSVVIQKIQEEIEGSGQLLGYRGMWKRLLLTHKIRVKRETVMELLRIIDPEGVMIRSRKKFKRRKYSVPVPNHIWHIDGYDKLKPYGFPIHGCIDGFSRKIIWMKVR